VAGDQFIFRGGDTWHFGNSGATPYVGGVWSINFTGSSGSHVYFGVDMTWFSGGSWSRPILTGDNPLTPNPGVTLDFVASCTYQVSGNNVMVNFGGNTFQDFDNFEMLGVCQKTNANPLFGHDIFLTGGSGPNWIENVYIHGWTHEDFSNASCGGGGAANCVNISLFLVGGTSHVLNSVADGSDSDPGGEEVFPPGNGMYDVAYSVFRYVQQIIGNNCHLLHDNILEHWYATVHPNIYECISAPSSSSGAFYNNIIRHICTDTSACPITALVNIWPSPTITTTEYWFNNLEYDISTGVNLQYFNVGTSGQSQGQINIFNNTFEFNVSGTALINCQPNSPLKIGNNHYIWDGSSQYSNCSGQFVAGSPFTELKQTHATATGQGYTSAQTYAYSPTSGGNSTVGAGTNETSVFCSALTTAAMSDATLSDAATACQSDTRYACTYNSTPHTVTCPTRTVVARPSSTAWDIGAYEFSAGASAPTVTTTTASGVTSSAALSGGVVTSNGGASVTSEGVCYATTSSPTSPCTSNGTATPFSSPISGLSANTLYHYRAFATNSAGTVYGLDLAFTCASHGLNDNQIKFAFVPLSTPPPPPPIGASATIGQ